MVAQPLIATSWPIAASVWGNAAVRRMRIARMDSFAAAQKTVSPDNV